MATPTAAGQLPVKYRKSGKRDKLLDLCRDYYKISHDNYKDTIEEGQEIIDMYHNRQYTQAQINILKSNGQPIETFNVIKLFTNSMIGYLETVVTECRAEPRYPQSATTALVLNDVLQVTLDDNDWTTMEKFMKIDGILTGLMCAYEEVVPTGNKDQFGRDLFDIKLEHIPSWQIRLDPQSQREDYADARFIHHFKWMPESAVLKAWPQKGKDLVEYYNFLEDSQADYTRVYAGHDVGKYKDYDNYLICKTIVHHKGKVWSVIWNDEVILEKKEVTFKEVRFPFRVTKMSKSDRAEYYGPFRDVVETQKAINQALLQIQLLINTSKAFVEDGSVENMEEFRELFGRVNVIIPVLSLQGIKIEDMSKDVVAQYAIIDKALDRIKLVLGINDSFLGNAYASDSGRKVQIQKMASASQMTMLVDRSGAQFKFIGQDVLKLVRQYYRGNQVLKVADPLNAFHYVEINPPLLMPTGMVGPDGVPEMQPQMIPDLDPETGEVVKDDMGNVIMIPLNDPNTDIEFADIDVKVVSSRTENADEKNQILFETFTNGPMGQITMQYDPAGAFRIMAMQVSEYGTKHSVEIAQVLMGIAMKIDQGQVDPQQAMQALGPDIQKLMGGAMGGSTGNVQNMPQTNSGQTAGNSGGVPQPGNEGGRP